MKFNINKSEFLNALSIVAKGASSRSTLPILSGIYIQAKGSRLTMQATDLERSIRYDVAALVEEEGETVISERIILEIVKSLSDMAVEVKTDGNTASISCGNSSFTVKTLDPQDFPPFPTVAVENRVKLSFAEFSATVKRVAKAVSKDQSRAVLTGVLMRTNADKLRLVATDSYRLALGEVALEGECDTLDVLVSGAFLLEVASLPKVDEFIEVGVSENQVVFTYQDMVLINRRIEGQFPAYERIIPQNFASSATFNTADIITAVKRAGVMINSSSAVKFDIDAAASTALISAAAQDIGSAEEVVSCEVVGSDMQIGFNHQYVIDGLTSMPTDTVQLNTVSSMKAGVFKATGTSNFTYLVMPMRFS